MPASSLSGLSLAGPLRPFGLQGMLRRSFLRPAIHAGHRRTAGTGNAAGLEKGLRIPPASS
jgi:hypothetical protein